MGEQRGALEQAGMVSPEIEFEYVDGAAAGNRVRFTFLGEGESMWINESTRAFGPCIVERRNLPGSHEPMAVCLHCDDPEVINDLVRWIEFVATGKARLVIGTLWLNVEKLQMFRRARAEYVYRDDDLRSM